MTRTLAFFSALTAFALAAQAVRDHAEVIGTGYELSRLERLRESVLTSETEARERFTRLAAPDHLGRRAEELGLATAIRRDFPVVRIGPGGRTDGAVARGRGR